MNLQLCCLLFCALVAGQRIERSLTDNCYAGRLLYEAMGCRPVYPKGIYSYYGDCPMEYNNCPAYTVLPNHCRYGNFQYAIGEQIRNMPRCLYCNCDKFPEANSTEIICAIADCAAPQVLENEECYLGYNSLDDCCASVVKCPPFSSNLNCKICGTEYKDGTIYQLPGRCVECLCKGGKNICQKVRCTFELDYADLIRKNCAPVYYKDSLCCPAAFACSEHIEMDKIEQCDDKEDSDLHCTLEKMHIRQNQKLHGSIYGQNITCTCDIPPLATCIFN